mmetsp:Transcript_2442/g.5873  ORF Transcript_2442/g.5873 Transcript_2442/m.5873 type:complete len:232 (-) Transcript_2442:86-781(-)
MLTHSPGAMCLAERNSTQPSEGSDVKRALGRHECENMHPRCSRALCAPNEKALTLKIRGTRASTPSSTSSSTPQAAASRDTERDTAGGAASWGEHSSRTAARTSGGACAKARSCFRRRVSGSSRGLRGARRRGCSRRITSPSLKALSAKTQRPLSGVSRTSRPHLRAALCRPSAEAGRSMPRLSAASRRRGVPQEAIGTPRRADVQGATSLRQRASILFLWLVSTSLPPFT